MDTETGSKQFEENVDRHRINLSSKMQELNSKKVIIIQLQGRLETLENMENELLNSATRVTAQYDSVCKETEAIGETLCSDVRNFVDNESIYMYSGAINKSKTRLIEEKAIWQNKNKQLDRDLKKMLEKDEINLKRITDEQQLDSEINSRAASKAALNKELEDLNQSIEKLKYERSRLFSLPEKDRTFIRLRKQLSETKRQEENNQKLHSSLENELFRMS